MEERIYRFIVKGERVIFLFFLIAFVSVLVSQCILAYPQVGMNLRNRFLQDMGSESISVMTGTNKIDDTANLKIKVLGHEFLRSAYILINNKRVASFTDSEVEVMANNHDLISIDGSFYNRPFTFQIVSVSHGVLSPTMGQEITTTGTLESFGRVCVQAKNSL